MDLQKIAKAILSLQEKPRQLGRAAGEEATGFIQDIQKNLQERAKGVQETIGEFTYSPETLPQDLSYRLRNMQNRFVNNADHLAQVPYETFMKAEDRGAKEWEESSPTQRLAMPMKYGSFKGKIAEPSANYHRINIHAPKEDVKGATFENEALSRPGFLPGAERYLRSISSSVDPNMPENAWGTFFSQGPEWQEAIRYSSDLAENHPYAGKDVAAHESLHAAADVFGVEELGNFVADFNQAYQANPDKYQPIIEWIQHYKESRKDTPYFDNPLAEANELFAEIGAQYGPQLANDPILGKYYQRVFNKMHPAAQPQPERLIRFEDGSTRVGGQGWVKGIPVQQ